jgi:hypothetical protein
LLLEIKPDPPRKTLTLMRDAGRESTTNRYRCYFVGKDGHFLGAENADAETLEAIIKHCEDRLAVKFINVGGAGFEIWQGPTCLHRSGN